jgi:ankyrin repeat protein
VLLLLLLLLLLQEASPEELATIQRLQLHTAPDIHGWTALHYAAATHKVKLVQQLLEIGADPAAADKHGLMPLHLACMGRVKEHSHLYQLWRARGILVSVTVS